MSPACVSLYMCMFGGVMVGAPQHFVMAHLTKQRQLTFLVLCHVPYSVTSQDCGCKDPITPPLSISLLGVVVVVMKCLGWGLGGGGVSLHSRQTMLFECKASSASNPSPTLSITTATLLLFRWISQLFLDGLSHRRSSTGDMSSKPGHHPMWPLT